MAEQTKSYSCYWLWIPTTASKYHEYDHPVFNTIIELVFTRNKINDLFQNDNQFDIRFELIPNSPIRLIHDACTVDTGVCTYSIY